MLLAAPSCKAILNDCDAQACTPLMAAASKNNTYLVSALLAAKACTKKLNSGYMTAFDQAVSKNHLQSAQLLAKAAVSDDELCTTTSDAVDSNHPCCLKLLLHAKADPDESKQGTTLLAQAVLNEPSAQDLADNVQVLLYLLRAKASPFRQNMQPDEHTALYTAAAHVLTAPGEETATHLRQVLQGLANTMPENA